MGQKRDLTDTEKLKIVKYHSDGHSTLEIAKYFDVTTGQSSVLSRIDNRVTENTKRRKCAN